MGQPWRFGVNGWGLNSGFEEVVMSVCLFCIVPFTKMHVTFPQGRSAVSAFNLVFTRKLTVFSVCVCVRRICFLCYLISPFLSTGEIAHFGN